MQIILANPRGFCAGVERAIESVHIALKKYGKPIYVKHEIVHNKSVIKELEAAGAIFLDDVTLVPLGSRIIFSAHGVSREIEKIAKERDLMIIDATCPLVKKVHSQIKKYENKERKILLIGHNGHPEIEGTKGQIDEEVFIIESIEDVKNLPFSRNTPISYVTQTTLSVDETRDIINALNEKFYNIEGPALSDICYATQNRQDAVKNLISRVDLILVVGSKNSSNSNRLKNLAQISGVPAYLIDDYLNIDTNWLIEKNAIGITAGASAPEHLVLDIVDYLCRLNPQAVISELEGKYENVVFKIPTELC